MEAKEAVEALALAIVGNVVSDLIVKAMDARAGKRDEEAPEPEREPKHMRETGAE